MNPRLQLKINQTAQAIQVQLTSSINGCRANGEYAFGVYGSGLHDQRGLNVEF